ncbi:MAG: PqqD family protein, partial [Actinomycetes bacterium]
MADTFSSVGHAFVPRPVEGARFHRLPDGGIVIGEARATIDALDPLGSLVWQCCDGTVNLEDLGQELAEAFEAPVDQVVDDVIGLARTFGARGLLEGVEPAQGPAATSPTGLQPGDAMEPFALPDSAGQLARIGQG